MTGKLIFTIALVFISSLNVSVQELHAEPVKEKIFQSIGPQDGLRMLQARDDIVFLDVRTPEERSRGAIPGSRLVSIVDLANGRIPLPMDKAILLVCAVGGRNYVAGHILSKKGYNEVYSPSGGVKGWYKAGMPLTYDTPPAAKIGLPLCSRYLEPEQLSVR